ncbi:HflX-like GTP-binding protein [Nocardia sp. NPDC055321]
MAVDLGGAVVITAGMFSARVRDHGALMDALEARIAGLGGHVAGRLVQRRGVSGRKKSKNQRGGRELMDRAYSERVVFSPGKVRELAALRDAVGAGVIVFYNELTPRQRAALCRVAGCAVLDRRDLEAADHQT